MSYLRFGPDLSVPDPRIALIDSLGPDTPCESLRNLGELEVHDTYPPVMRRFADTDAFGASIVDYAGVEGPSICDVIDSLPASTGPGCRFGTYDVEDGWQPCGECIDCLPTDHDAILGQQHDDMLRTLRENHSCSYCSGV